MISVGRILRSQGKEGEVRLKFYRPELVRFSALKKIYIEREGGMKEYRVESLSRRGGAFKLKLESVTTLTLADSLAGCEVFVPEENLEVLEEGEYYLHQLEGCLVVDMNGKKIGVVVDVISVPDNNLLVVERDRKEILIPFHTSICKQVKVPEKEIRIDPPAGLLDLDEI